MDKLINETLGYLQQLIHRKANTDSRISSVVKEFEEVYGDDTQSYWEYSCYDKNDEFVISFSVDINGNAELIDDNDCY